MTDEEKKAFESVKDMFGDVTLKDIDEQSITIYGVAMLDVIKVLTIVEKQEKEIEHQKEKRENQKKELAILNAKQVEFNKLVNTVKSYEGQFKKQEKEIKKIKKEYERVRAGRNWLSEHISAQIATPELFDKLVEENYIRKEVSGQKEKEAYIEGTNAADKLCNKKWENKIKAKIEEVKGGTYDAKIVLQSFLKDLEVEDD